MSPYLQVDLDAKKRFPLVARAIGCGVGEVAWGLLELWELSWQRKLDVISAIGLAGCLDHPRAAAALVEFGFVAPVDGGFRVLGAEKYLRIAAAQKASAERTNSARSTVRSTVKKERSTVRSTVRSEDGLTPNTEHLTPIEAKALSAKKPADPRLKPLTERLVADYEAVRGEKYKHGGAKDALAIKALLTVSDDGGLISERWRYALESTDQWLRCSTFAQFSAKWNDLASPSEHHQGRYPDINGGIIRGAS
jgi:hypothetical protein